ncbi:MAG: hypothetical protein C5B50_26575 [Verrucomicrobia bacterium]|nr:MAG: hypothetical protein C5B50_26575 [Verrucomicrobiota bacterium]
MEVLLVLLLATSLAPLTHAENLAERYAASGELIITQFQTAPFPHPARADGHKYKDEFFSAKESYSDSTVAIFIPKGFHETGKIDLVVHFHGWDNNVTAALKKYELIEQLVESKRNAILVIPQGPRNASDSFGGKLEDTNGFKRFVSETMETLRQKSSLKRTEFELGKIVLSGHSGGYRVMGAIVDHGGLSDHVREVWLFDALYAETEQFLAWFDRYHGRLLNIYTEHGGTKEETEKLMGLLKDRKTAFWAGKESAIQSNDLKACQPIFIFTELPHDAVLKAHRTFRQFLETSCLSEK